MKYGCRALQEGTSLKFPIPFLNINQRFLILDVQKLERMFKTNTSTKFILVLLAAILVAKGQLIKRDATIDEKTSRLVTVTTGEPVLRTQTIQTKQTIISGNGDHHDHSDIVFDGPQEEIVMRINLQFDKELKHFRIQQLNYENEDLEDEVLIQDVTQTKKISQNVNHISNVVTTTKTVNQNVQESNVVSDASIKPFVSKVLLHVEPEIAVESQNEGEEQISSNKAEEQPIITAAVKADDKDEDPNNKWMRLFNVNHYKAEEKSEQKSSGDNVHKDSAELPIVTKAKELLAKKASLSHHQDEENSQEKESETEAESASINHQESTPDSESGSTPAEQTPPANSEGTTTPAEQTPPANTEEGSAPVEQIPTTEQTLAPTQQAPAEQTTTPAQSTPAVPTEQNPPTLTEESIPTPSEQTSPIPTQQTPAAPVPVELPAPVNTEGGSTPVEVPTNVEGSPAPFEQTPPASNESGSLQAEQTPPANNGEGSSAPVEQAPPASNQSESGSAPAAEAPQEQAQSEEAGFLSLFN